MQSIGKYSEFTIELTANGGFIKPGLVSCYIDENCSDISLITASLCHELVHYELQIDCLINPQPSSFVNEGIAQSYAEGMYLKNKGDSYISRWANIKDEEWETKILKSVNNDKWFLEQRSRDKTVGIGNAAIFEWITRNNGYGTAGEIFAASRQNDSKVDRMMELCGTSILDILSSLQR